MEHHGQREWLVHGPDLDTGYGSFQGLGGLEALVDEATGETTPIVDTVHGHVVAMIDLGDPTNATDDTIIFKQQQFGGYGPLPGSQQKPLEATESLTESLGWQSRGVDPTSFFAMGARHYDPLSGRFLSADPLGHSATPDLYSYAGGDPINFFDPTGREIQVNTSDPKAKQIIKDDIKRIRESDPRLDMMIRDLEDSPRTHKIITTDGYSKNIVDLEKGVGNQNHTITKYNYQVNIADPSKPPEGALVHELEHGWERDDFDRRGPDSPLFPVGNTDTGVPLAEERAVQTENIYYDATGIRLRETYSTKYGPQEIDYDPNKSPVSAEFGLRKQEKERESKDGIDASDPISKSEGCK